MSFKSNTVSFLPQVYPPFLLLVLFSPMLIGSIIDYNLIDSRYIAVNLVWLPLFTIPYVLLNKKWIYRTTVSLYFLVGVIEITHWIILKGPITITSLLVIANTNYQEAVEFMDLKATAWLLVLLPYIYLFIVALRNPPVIKKFKNMGYYIGIVFLASFVFIAENAINKRFIRKGVPEIAKVTGSFFQKISLFNEAMEKKTPREVKADPLFENKSQTFVLILGESGSRNHMSLYKNADTRDTNPRLEKRNDIVVYNDVVSPHSSTMNSLLSILTQSNLDNTIPFNESVDLIDIFHSAGFKTFWLSNQSPIGVWDNVVTVFGNKSDKSTYVNTTSNSSLEAVNNTSFDAKLFKALQHALRDKAKKKFIIVHLMGSHALYSKRYPNEFDVFEGENSKEEMIAEYDNSILYNDYILDSLFSAIKEYNEDNINGFSSAIYLSDHGENVYDENNNVGHDFSGTFPKSNVEIPFIVWLSPSYIAMNPDKYELIKKNENFPFVSDDLFHSVLDMNRIETPYLEPERSIFNTSYNSKRKRILSDGEDYDLKK